MLLFKASAILRASLAVIPVSPAAAIEIPPYTGKYNAGATKAVIPVHNTANFAPGNIIDSFLVTLFYPTLQTPNISPPTPYLNKVLAAILEANLQMPNGSLANLT